MKTEGAKVQLRRQFDSVLDNLISDLWNDFNMAFSMVSSHQETSTFFASGTGGSGDANAGALSSLDATLGLNLNLGLILQQQLLNQSAEQLDSGANQPELLQQMIDPRDIKEELAETDSTDLDEEDDELNSDDSEEDEDNDNDSLDDDGDHSEFDDSQDNEEEPMDWKALLNLPKNEHSKSSNAKNKKVSSVSKV